MAPYFPIALDLTHRRCLVVGGGPVAARKVEALLDARATVVVVAPHVSAEIEALGVLRAIEVRSRAYHATDCDEMFLTIAATDDRATNARVAVDARTRGVLVNAVDDAESCDFITPAVVRRGDVQVAVTTGGSSPALARHLRERLEELLTPAYGTLASLLAEVRGELQAKGERRDPETWQRAIRAALLLVQAGDTHDALHALRSALRVSAWGTEVGTADDWTQPSAIADPQAPAHSSSGRVVLVGAGPGDPGLLTLAGRDAIAAADVIVYDRLVNRALLDRASPGARLIYVGKQRGERQMNQEEINDLLCSEARGGNVVVRLKGGDPFVFGRGGEEALAAREAGIPCTVIPGISAALAAPAAAGIPVTHRGLSSAFTVVTGHEDPSKLDGSVDWDALVQVGGTLVLLMAVETLPAVCARLMESGLEADTPAAVIQSGTTEGQRIVTGCVANLAERARSAGITAPATTVIGEVAVLADALAPQVRARAAALGGAHGSHG